jgi:hypothetical protein
MPTDGEDDCCGINFTFGIDNFGVPPPPPPLLLPSLAWLPDTTFALVFSVVAFDEAAGFDAPQPIEHHTFDGWY